MSSNRGPGGSDINVTSAGKHVIALKRSLSACRRCQKLPEVGPRKSYIRRLRIRRPKVHGAFESRHNVRPQFDHAWVPPGLVDSVQLWLMGIGVFECKEGLRSSGQTARASSKGMQLLDAQ